MKNKSNLTYIDRKHSIIEIDIENKFVTKRFKDASNITSHINSNIWLELYRNMFDKSKNKKYQMAEIFDVNNSEIIMKYYDIKTHLGSIHYNNDLPREIIIDAIKFLNCMWLFTLESYNNGKYFANYDLNFTNLVITKDDKIVLIDPDSFDFRRREKLWYYHNSYQKIINDCNAFLLH